MLAALRSHATADWIMDPADQTHTHTLSWDGDRSRWAWKDNRADAQPIWLETLSAEALGPLVAKAPAKPRILVWIPAPAELAESLRFGGNIATVQSPALADYVLAGRPCDPARQQCAEYAWMLPDVPRGAENIDRPIRTDWVTVDSDVSAASQSLKDAALGLARILGWLRLSSPEADDSWPYHLAFQNAKTKDMLASSDVKGGDCYKLLLKASPGDVEREAHLRRVYVFAVDSFGRATLLFGDNLANEFPRFDAASAAVPETIALSNRDCDFQIGEPYGTDNYFLLASATPIDNPQTVFNFDGVRARGGSPASNNPLAVLLENAGMGKRGSVANIPVNWSIQHLRLVSGPPGGAK